MCWIKLYLCLATLAWLEESLCISENMRYMHFILAIHAVERFDTRRNIFYFHFTPHSREMTAYRTQLIQWLLMTRQHTESGLQQTMYWSSRPNTLCLQYQLNRCSPSFAKYLRLKWRWNNADTKHWLFMGDCSHWPPVQYIMNCNRPTDRISIF